MQNKDNNEDIINGNRRAKTLFFLLLSLAVIWLAVLTLVAEKISIENYSTFKTTLIFTATVTILAMAGVAAFLFTVGFRTYKAHCYPPPGMKVPFTTTLKRGSKANQMAYLCFLAAAALLLNMLVKAWALITMIRIN